MFLGLPLLILLAPVVSASLGAQRISRTSAVRSVSLKEIIKTGVAENWGGEHVRIKFNDDEGTVEFDCAHGTITDPLKTDSEGRFNLNGTYVTERPGHVRLNVQRVSQPAHYSGTIKGDEMLLSVTLNKDSQEIGTFTLRRGSEGLIRKCR